MPLPTVYLDTSFISAMWYEGNDVSVLARRFHSRDWWDGEREYFRVVTSVATELELASGRFPKQAECLRVARRLNYLPVTKPVREFAHQCLGVGLVPAGKNVDAVQLGLCVVHSVDYLLSWNYAHLANPIVQQKLNELCNKAKLRTPWLVSPETIPQVRLGQTIRRGD